MDKKHKIYRSIVGKKTCEFCQSIERKYPKIWQSVAGKYVEFAIGSSEKTVKFVDQ